MNKNFKIYHKKRSEKVKSIKITNLNYDFLINNVESDDEEYREYTYEDLISYFYEKYKELEKNSKTMETNTKFQDF